MDFSVPFPDQPSRYQDFNFYGLYASRRSGGKLTSSQLAKLVCLLKYFERIVCAIDESDIQLDKVVSFSRQVLTKPVDWSSSDSILTALTVKASEFIEDQKGQLQVDFANKMIGGGVLRSGCVQEEIRFIICPELLVSLLITEEMSDNETVLMCGAERYSNYIGYSQSFDYDGPAL
jgi:poly(ADP-ribose) glycohydrolase